MFWTVLFLIFGFALLLKSADFLVDGAAGLAKRYNVPKIVIGLTLVAFGTSAPEGAVSIIAALQKSSDISLSNIIGSNISNIALVLGVAAIFRSLPVRQSIITKGLPLNILAVIVLLILGYDVFFQNHNVVFNRLTLGDGIILLSFFIVFLYYIYGDFKAAQVKEEVVEKKEKIHVKESLPYLLLLSFGGLAGILVGGKLVVDNAVLIAQALHVSQALIGLTIVALGTSLPEFATSFVAAWKRESEIAIGNIIGSNIFNIYLVLGLSSVFSTIDFNPKLFADVAIMLTVTVLLFFFTLHRKELKRSHGITFVALYMSYLVFLGVRDFMNFDVLN